MFGRKLRVAQLVAVTPLILLAGCATGSATRPMPTARSTPVSATPAATTSRATPTQSPTSKSNHSTTTHVVSSASQLPLTYRTGSATQVITVTAASMRSTSATLRTWTKSGSGWRAVGPAVPAYLGSDGLTNAMSEFVSATPTGSYTLTQAFGRNSDPGTALPYFRTTPADWWISQAGPVYNTHQRCLSGTDGNGCGFHAPSEHLYYETPYYNYAVVIDTPFGSSAYPHGSAVFLHVHPPGTGPTQGCVSIAEDQLVRILRWLEPSAHPRILIGVG